MSYYSNDFIEQVRQVSDIVPFIQQDTPLKGRGDRLMGLCPFSEHSEKTASFCVSISKQVYYCFGCQNSGNIFTYLKKQRGMSFPEALDYLAKKYNIPLPIRKKDVFAKKFAYDIGLLEILEKACGFYENNLNRLANHHELKKYLSKRGWSAKLVESFRLGYAPKGNRLFSFFNTAPLQIKHALKLGLLQISSTESRNTYDCFRHRLIFPIFSVKKQVIGFGARCIDNAVPKYINSRESEVFHKGQTFYGLDKSAPYLREKSQAIVVEGYTDFLSLWQEGFRNLVAVLGTAFTPIHAKILKRYVESVVFVFDSDEAGIRAAQKSLPVLLQQGLKPKQILLSKGQDPDEFIRLNGKKAFESRLNDAQDMFFVFLRQKLQELKQQRKDISCLIDQIAPVLAVIQDKTLKSIYTQRFLDLFGSDARFMEKALNDKIRTIFHQSSSINVVNSFNSAAKKIAVYRPAAVNSSSVTEKHSVSSQNKISLSKALYPERLILVLCLEKKEFLQSFIKQNVISILQTKEIITIFEEIQKKFCQTPNQFDKILHLIINEIADSHFIFKSFYPILKGSDIVLQRQIFEDCIKFLVNRKKYAKASELLVEMKTEDKQNIPHLEKVFQLTKQRLKK